MSRNQLAAATSPYLALHKDNPVHWHAWGDEAFAEAQRTGKPILLSIGYTACHWCHVMNHESFGDADTAEKMNDLYVCVKVDREERPDLDQVYQGAANLMGYQGGWPLTVFLTPQGAPFWAGGYFPKEPLHGQTTFQAVLDDVAAIYVQQKDRVEENVATVMRGLQDNFNRNMSGPLDALPTDEVAIFVGQRFDIFNGGLTGAPKFPNAALVELLWRAWLRTGVGQFPQLVSLTMDHMLQGGLYDHIGGGFLRYTTDERWRLPHFEKMLPDTAQMIDLMTMLWQYNRAPLFLARTTETIGWLLREMKQGDAFAASLNADSEGEEGKFYLWTEAEIDAALADTYAQKFKEAYGISQAGPFNGRNFPTRLGGAGSYPLSEPDEAMLARQRTLLLAARGKRVRPMRDDKVLADWNGMAIAALANAGAAFQNREWLDAAIRAFDWVVANLGDGDTLAHSHAGGAKSAQGFADDYAHMARAALVLWEVTGQTRFLDRAKAWTAQLNARFWDGEKGGYFFTASDAPPLIVRARTIADASVSPANATMLVVLHRLFLITGEPEYGGRVRATLEGFGGEAGRRILMCGNYFNALDTILLGLQVVIFGPRDNAKTADLIAAVQGRSVPARMLLVVTPDSPLPEQHPAHGKDMVNGQPTAYVCQHLNCSPPITSPVALAQALALPNTANGPQMNRAPAANHHSMLH